MKQNTRFKGNGGSWIDLLITNSKFPFKKIISFEVGLSDHHQRIHAIFKTKFEKFEPKKSIYRNFIQYDSDQFKLDVFNSMSAMKTKAAFENNFVLILGKHAPTKTKFFYVGIKSPVLIRTLEANNDQITSKKQGK